MKNFFYHKRLDRVVLLLIGMLLLGLVYVVPSLHDDGQALTLSNDTLLTATCDTLYASLYGARRPAVARRQARLFFFDPNQADSATFVALGLPSFVAHRLLRYRAAGGRFDKPRDLGRIYGIDTGYFRRLLPYIAIDTVALAKRYTAYYHREASPYPQKFKQDTLLELNEADTLLLQRVPGIGRGFAYRIVHYRTQLGGFYSKEQLHEIAGVNDTLYGQWVDWFWVDTQRVHKLQVHKESLTRLYRHPYLNFEQAKILRTLAREQGALQGMDDLQLLEEFDAADRHRLRPYLSFD